MEKHSYQPTIVLMYLAGTINTDTYSRAMADEKVARFIIEHEYQHAVMKERYDARQD